MRLSPQAEADLIDAVAYIELGSPQNAKAVAERILLSAMRIGDTPQIGRPGRLPGTREFPVRRTGYILVYRIGKDEISIARVVHGHENSPPP